MTKTEINRTAKQTQKQTAKQTAKQTHNQMAKQTAKQTHKKTHKKTHKQFLTIMLVLIVFSALLANTAFAEASQTNVIISDSISPVRLVVDANSNTVETRTVTITNTGNVPAEYIFYVAQTGGRENTASTFELSDTRATVQPGESHRLEISIQVQNINPNLEEYRLKIVRNPDTQTPVGYIIPIDFIGGGPGSGGGSGGGGSTGSATVAQNQSVTGGNDSETSAKEAETSGTESNGPGVGGIETGGTETSGMASNDSEAGGAKSGNGRKIIGIVLVLILSSVVLAGIIIRKRMKAASK